MSLQFTAGIELGFQPINVAGLAAMSPTRSKI